MFGANAFGWPYFGQAYAGSTVSNKTLVVATVHGLTTVSAALVSPVRVISPATINGVASVAVSLIKGAMQIAQINGLTAVTARFSRPLEIFPAIINGTTTVIIAPFAGRWLLWNRRLRINQSFHETLADAKSMLRRRVLHGERGKDYDILQEVPSDVDETYDPSFSSET